MQSLENDIFTRDVSGNFIQFFIMRWEVVPKTSMVRNWQKSAPKLAHCWDPSTITKFKPSSTLKRHWGVVGWEKIVIHSNFTVWLAWLHYLVNSIEYSLAIVLLILQRKKMLDPWINLIVYFGHFMLSILDVNLNYKDINFWIWDWVMTWSLSNAVSISIGKFGKFLFIAIWALGL